MRLNLMNLPRPEKCYCKNPALTLVEWTEVSFVECETCCAIEPTPKPVPMTRTESYAVAIASVVIGGGLIALVAWVCWGAP